MADDLTQLVNIPNKDENSDVIKSPVIRALLSHFSRYGEQVDVKKLQYYLDSELD